MLCRSPANGKWLSIPWQDRFMEKVEKTESCWLWLGGRFSNGYGSMYIKMRDNGRRVTGLAHRLSWELHFGPILSGMIVCHKCDVRLCVRPDHLFLGTQADNLADMDHKGRRVNSDNRGELNPAAKLTADQVLEIRQRYRPRIITRKMLAQEYSVSEPLIDKILSGRVWNTIVHTRELHAELDKTRGIDRPTD